jgi:alkylated DNA repair dioxygenase AlkB
MSNQTTLNKYFIKKTNENKVNKFVINNDLIPTLERKHYNISENSWLEIIRIPKEVLNIDYDKYWNMHPKEFGEVMMCGNLVKTPRWQQSYGKPYYFTGINHDALEMTDDIKELLDFINNLGYEEYNQVLINWYEDGNHYIGSHSDDESQLVNGSSIMTLSLGETMVFRIRNKFKNNIIEDIEVKDGMILVMGGRFQKKFKHEIVKITSKKNKVESRISVTFRKFKK